MNGFNQIGAAIGNIQYIPARRIDLDFPSGFGPEFHDVFAGTQINSVNVGPLIYLREALKAAISCNGVVKLSVAPNF